MGFDKHLSNIRSFAKLTGIGMTIIGTDFVRILEEVLPKKYGGTATDYQLLEEEGELGQTHLNLIISPLVGRIDEDAVITTVLEELRKSAYGGKLAAGLWSQEKFLRIIRTSPISKMGKVMTLYLGKKK
jgi:microsomal dipeptidase-like Zn-dependent dipeptidase